MTLKAKMLMKERVDNSNKFDRFEPFRILYNETSKFDHTNKGKPIQPLKLTSVTPNTIIRPNKASRKKVEMNKPNNSYARPMIAKCF